MQLCRGKWPDVSDQSTAWYVVPLRSVGEDLRYLVLPTAPGHRRAGSASQETVLKITRTRPDAFREL